MKKTIIITLILSTIIFFTGMSNTEYNSGIDYEKQWKTIESLSNKGLPKSALKTVNDIYEQAKKQNNAPEFIKAGKRKVLYKQEDLDAWIKKVGKQRVTGSQSSVVMSYEP